MNLSIKRTLVNGFRNHNYVYFIKCSDTAFLKVLNLQYLFYYNAFKLNIVCAKRFQNNRDDSKSSFLVFSL